ncbi:MAG TPA: 30S ribosomal protein S18 [Patescibacteria group bacterium]|nr:30S ribosomal protein S18 [Patescibacteria group bacterium]
MPKGKKPRRKFQKTTLRKCYFCEGKIEPSVSNTADLLKFLTERGKIIPRSRSGLCAKHQRALARNVKHARQLALLSFIVRS